MRTIYLTKDNQSEVIAEAAEVLKRDGSIAYPTDTVYGLGANPFDDFAVRRLFRVKKRPASKPVPLMVSSIAMAKKLAHIDSQKEEFLRSIWPGAVSVILYKRRMISSFISANTETVALRIPDSKFCMSLIRAFNSPITATSANVSGEDPVSNPQEIKKRFEREAFKPDLIIDGGVLKSKRPSTVIDLTHEVPKVTRVGPVSPKDLAKILKMQ